MKKQSKQTPDKKRREFLRGSVGAGAGIVVAATLPGLTSASVEETEEERAAAQKGYRLTPHIAAYYKTTVR